MITESTCCLGSNIRKKNIKIIKNLNLFHRQDLGQHNKSRFCVYLLRLVQLKNLKKNSLQIRASSCFNYVDVSD